MRNLHHVVVTTATFLASLSAAPMVSAQSSAPEEPPATFGEISNKPAASSPTTANAGAPEAPATNAPAEVAAVGSATPAAPPPTSPPRPAVSAPASASAAPPPAECKEGWVRDGFYLRIMSGGGFATFRGDGPSGSTSVSGMSSNSIVAIGGAIAPRLVLAGTIQATSVSGEFKGGPFAGATTFIAVDGTVKSTAPETATKSATAALSQIGAMVDWYPSATNGAHLGLSVGLGTTAVVNQADNSSYAGMSGAATVLVGYDWPISRAWALGLALVATGSTKASLKHAKTGHDAGYELTPFSIGLTTSILYF